MLPTDSVDEGCNWYQFRCTMGSFGETLAGNAIENLASAVLESMADVVGIMATSWVFVGTPTLTGGEGGTAVPMPHESTGQLETLMGYVAWVCLGICVLALMFLGATMALNARRGEGFGHISKIGIVLFATVLISGAAGIITGILPSAGPSNASRTVGFLQAHLWWYMGAAAVVSVIIGAVRMVWQQRAEPGKDLVKSLITLVLVAGAGVPVIGMAVSAADGFSAWIILSSTDEEFGAAVMAMLALALTENSGIGAFLVMFLGIFVIFFSFLQIILMLIRVGMIVILTGTFPLAASFTNTEMGQQWFKKFCAWLIAFILYKPAAAIIYAAAFQLVGSSVFSGEDESGLLNFLVGVMMMLISLVAMPALMKFVVPMATLGGGGVGGAMAGAAGLVGGKLASGAMQIGQDQATSGTADAGGGGGGGSPSGATETSGQDQGPAPEQQEDSSQKETTSPAGNDEQDQPPQDPGAQPGPGLDSGPDGTSEALSTGGDPSMAATGGVPVTQVADQLQQPIDGASSDVTGAVDDATKDPHG